MRRLSIATAAAVASAMPFVAHADCLDDAAAFRHINVQLVRAIAKQESGMRPDAVNVNRNGSE
ncbi:lytic transglycosylase, partial [Pseudomonas sp. SIMBA_065]